MDTKSITLPVFGNITLENADWKYKYESNSWAYDFNGNETDLDVHFTEVTDEDVEAVGQALKDMDKLNKMVLETIKQDFKDSGETQYYINEWNEDIFEQIFSEEEFQEFLQGTDASVSVEERLLSKLRLVRFGVYAGSEDEFITMDYAFGYDMDRGFRDNMLVIRLDQDYEVCEITTEG